MILHYTVSELTPYINWLYYLHAWGISARFASVASVHACMACRTAWVNRFSPEERPQAIEAQRLYDDSIRLLQELEGQLQIQAVFRLCRAGSDGDDLLLDGLRLPLLRQQTAPKGQPCLCLSDFVRPLSPEATDTVGLFATSVSSSHEEASCQDPYRHLLLQTLADRLAEAAVERMHLYVRREAWGYAPDEALSIPDLLNEKFQGIRPAVGYPSLPDQSITFLIDRLLSMGQIGISLTETGAMHPHASTCGLLLAHPAARYFAVGPIDEGQLADYARRRGLPLEQMRQFLAGNLAH